MNEASRGWRFGSTATSLTQREARGIAVAPDAPAAQPNLEFSERLTLKEGKIVVVSAIDRDNLSAQKVITVIRQVDRAKVWAVVIGISKYKTVIRSGMRMWTRRLSMTI